MKLSCFLKLNREFFIISILVGMVSYLNCDMALYNYYVPAEFTLMKALYWALPILLMLYYVTRNSTKIFSNTFFYYAYRLQNKAKFLLTQFLKILIEIVILVAIRLVITLLTTTISYEANELINTSLYLILFIFTFDVIVFVFYQIFRTDIVIIFSLSTYMFLLALSDTYRAFDELVFYRNIDGMYYIVTAMILIIAYIVNIKVINKKYLYT